MTNLLNKLPQLIENKENNKLLEPIIYPTAWGKWCIAYKELMFDANARPNKRFSVIIEPDRDPVRIEDTIGRMNEYIGNAPSFEEAITMVLDYINKYYTIK
jgi:hypothetical protein